MHARRAALAVAVSATLLLGLVASSASAHRPPRGDAWRVELLCEGRPCPETTRRGDRWVMGQYGDRYTIRLHNDSDHAVEAVVTVDGRDVVNGRSGSYANRGYIVGAWDSVDIDGWRVNLSQVAAFRFTDVPDSYAGRVDGGRNTGVIGVAFFPERERPVVRPAPIRPNTYGGGRAPEVRPQEVRAPASRQGRARLGRRARGRPGGRRRRRAQRHLPQQARRDPGAGHTLRRDPQLVGQRGRLPARQLAPQGGGHAPLRRPRGPDSPGHRPAATPLDPLAPARLGPLRRPSARPLPGSLVGTQGPAPAPPPAPPPAPAPAPAPGPAPSARWSPTPGQER